MFPILNKRRGFLKKSIEEVGDKAALDEAPPDEHGDPEVLAEHHRKLAEHYQAIADAEKAPEEGDGETAPETSDSGPEAIMFGDSAENPPDTVESAKYGPVEDETEETPEHEAGESANVEKIEESRKPPLGLSWKDGGEEEKKPAKSGRSFRPFKKGGSFKL